jgi:hypothetical protein
MVKKEPVERKEKKEPFFKVLKRLLKENLLIVSLVGWVASAIFLTLSLIGIFIPGKVSGVFKDWNDLVGDWMYWILVVTIITIGIFTWLLWSGFNKRTKFEKLISTDSKAEFVRNLDELEELGSDLGDNYWNRVLDKKRTFKIE